MKLFPLTIAIISICSAAGLVIFSVWRQSEQVIVRDLHDQNIHISESNISTKESQINEAHIELPYPGILPTHLLYPLKMIRDRLILATTTDEETLIKLHLHYCQKRLAASRALIGDPQPSQAIKTLLRAHIYLTKAYELLKKHDIENNHKVLWTQLMHTTTSFNNVKKEVLLSNSTDLDFSTKQIETDIAYRLNMLENVPNPLLEESSNSTESGDIKDDINPDDNRPYL